MPRLIPAALLLLAVTMPAAAQQSDILRLACKASDPAMSPPLAFSIDLAAKDAVETTNGKHYGVTSYRDGLGLYDPAQGPATVVFRIDRVTGRFARVDTQLRWDGTCEKVEPKL
ncbi:MAG: hypothetical protein HYU59_12680 [Magnetospirillum gryphiswaldense]|nr:hypothetical protein [Magnetospirillum gryphiswaldense]